MQFFGLVSIVAILPVTAFAAAEAPAGSSVAQQAMVVDWARYQAACKGGAMDGHHDTGVRYCGVADYLLYRLNVKGICLDDNIAAYFTTCVQDVTKDPLKGYEF